MKLSHSRIELYKMCSHRYDLNYNKKIKPTTISSALFFGGLVGDAVQLLALKKKENHTNEEKELLKHSALYLFLTKMRKIIINGIEKPLHDNESVNYYLGDYDPNILNGADINAIEVYKENINMSHLTFEDVKDDYKRDKLPKVLKKMTNFMFWISCRRRGIIMIKAYEKEILPRIIKVHSIEKEINIKESGGGDSIIGYIDMICDYKMDDGSVQTILFDHKTSSVKYPSKKLIESQQLAIYDYSEHIGTVGYIVMVKKIKIPKIGKRKNEIYCDIQVMIGSIEKDVTVGILENAAYVLEKIQDNVFKKNFSGCFAFGQRCPYYGICRDKKELNQCNLIKRN